MAKNLHALESTEKRGSLVESSELLEISQERRRGAAGMQLYRMDGLPTFVHRTVVGGAPAIFTHQNDRVFSIWICQCPNLNWIGFALPAIGSRRPELLDNSHKVVVPTEIQKLLVLRAVNYGALAQGSIAGGAAG